MGCVVGLDPPGKVLLSELLNRVSTETEHGGATPVVLGLRPQDAVPSWSTHIAYVEDNTIVSMGPKSAVATEVQQKANKTLYLEGDATAAPDQGVVEKAWSGISGLKSAPKPATTLAEPLVEMEKVKISYYSKVILDNFSWTIRRGERWGLFGPNGNEPFSPFCPAYLPTSSRFWQNHLDLAPHL